MADAVLGQIFDWIYGKLAGFFSEFFEMMNMMGAELFDLPWTQAVVLFFSRFAWVLYAVGLVVAGFEYAIQSQSGRGDLHGLALNGIKGFFCRGRAISSSLRDLARFTLSYFRTPKETTALP